MGSLGAKASVSYWFEVPAPSVELGISLWVSQGVQFTTDLQNSTLAFVFLLHLRGPSLACRGPGKEWGALVLADRSLLCYMLGSAGECERLGPPQARGLPPLCGVMTPPSWDQSPSKRPSFSERWQPEMVDVAECLRPLSSIALRVVIVLFFFSLNFFFFLLLVSIYAYHVVYSANFLVCGLRPHYTVPVSGGPWRSGKTGHFSRPKTGHFRRSLRRSVHGTAQSCPSTTLPWSH